MTETKLITISRTKNRCFKKLGTKMENSPKCRGQKGIFA